MFDGRLDGPSRGALVPDFVWPKAVVLVAVGARIGTLAASMDADKTDSREHAPLTHGRAASREVAQSFFAGQFWFIFRNVVGWILILASPLVGALPGPGGILVFIVGFALASIPGKRRITTRMMRGRPIRINQQMLVVLTTVLSLAACAAIVFTYRAHLDGVVR